jgi:hypothetical protein
MSRRRWTLALAYITDGRNLIAILTSMFARVGLMHVLGNGMFG